MPPSIIPLIVIVAIFALHYATGVLRAMHPEYVANPAYPISMIAAGALLSGILLGRNAHFARVYRRSV